MATLAGKDKSEEGHKTASEGCVFGDSRLRDELRAHFQSVSLSSAQKQAIEATLLARPRRRKSSFTNFITTYKRVLFTHFATAAAAVLVTLGVASYFDSSNESSLHDPVSEVVSLSDNLNFPADFNLDGNLNDLPDLIRDSLPNHTFKPAIPAQIAQDFSAYEGRFFLYKGEQGVGISVMPASSHADTAIPLRLHQGFERKQPSTLYIVKLSDKNRSAFPFKRTSRKIASASGKIKRVYAWSDGTYGYAMVQPLGLGD
ncbi:MAG: hypothetical protein V4591_06810 [Bdellovibrionota bacterium]